MTDIDTKELRRLMEEPFYAATDGGANCMAVARHRRPRRPEGGTR